MIRIITVEREYGCGGGEIAQLLADDLGWKLWDHLLTEEIAQNAKCPEAVVESREERNDPLYYRLLRSFMRGSYEGSQNVHKLNLVDSECIMKFARQLILRVASSGNSVIVGRGSQHFLQDREDTLRVFLYAPREEKVRRLISRGKSEADAQELVDSVDRDRKEYVRKYFHMDWPNLPLYQILLNTASGNIIVVQTILNFMNILNAHAHSGEKLAPAR
ncbi:MAG TPA: cytidylate kinase-like family protein [Candidatus Acidoferrales bacterium]|nr:cytidylate kinase-like family protein [Candidatus Acidoferrales bacterium]